MNRFFCTPLIRTSWWLLLLLPGVKEQQAKEIEELKQTREEQDVRLSALKSQYEGRLLRQDRELRELRETQAHAEPREETQEQSTSKVAAPRPLSQLLLSLLVAIIHVIIVIIDSMFKNSVNSRSTSSQRVAIRHSVSLEIDYFHYQCSF